MSTSGTNRVNTMYYTYKRNKGNLDGCGLPRPAQEVHQGRGDRAQDREVDYYAMVRMSTFINLVDRVGYVAVDVPGPIVDTYYGRRGLYFPDENDYRLVGNAACKKRPFECRSALAYVRSRHGTQAGGSNNDFKRAYRQHDFIFDATQRVRSRGNGAALTDLMEAITPKVWTNVPKNLKVARDIYNLIGGLSMSGSDRVVLRPVGVRHVQGRAAVHVPAQALGDPRLGQHALRILERQDKPRHGAACGVSADRLLDGTGGAALDDGVAVLVEDRHHRGGRPGVGGAGTGGRAASLVPGRHHPARPPRGPRRRRPGRRHRCPFGVGPRDSAGGSMARGLCLERQNPKYVIYSAADRHQLGPERVPRRALGRGVHRRAEHDPAAARHAEAADQVVECRAPPSGSWARSASRPWRDGLHEVRQGGAVAARSRRRRWGGVEDKSVLAIGTLEVISAFARLGTVPAAHVRQRGAALERPLFESALPTSR